MNKVKKILGIFLSFFFLATLLADPAADLQAAVKANDLVAVETAINAGAKPDKIEDKGGWTPMMSAAYNGHLDIVVYLVEKAKTKAKIDYQSSSTLTPLMIACEAGQVAVVKYFLDKKAKIELKDWEGKTALHHAAAGGNTEILQMLLDKKADLNGVTKNNWSALMMACMEGKTDAVRFLISKGALLNIKATSGFSTSRKDWYAQFVKDDTALSIAITRNQTEIIKLLTAAGARNYYFDKMTDQAVIEKLGTNSTEIDFMDKTDFEEFMKTLRGATVGQPGKVKSLKEFSKIKFEANRYILVTFKYKKDAVLKDFSFAVFDASKTFIGCQILSFRNTTRTMDVITGYEEKIMIILPQAFNKKNFDKTKEPLTAELQFQKNYGYAKYFYLD